MTRFWCIFIDDMFLFFNCIPRQIILSGLPQHSSLAAAHWFLSKIFVQVVPKKYGSDFQRILNICYSQSFCVIGFSSPIWQILDWWKGNFCLKKKNPIWVSIVKIWARKNEWLLRVENPQILKYAWLLFINVLVLSHDISKRAFTVSNSTSNSLLQTSQFHLFLIEMSFLNVISG